MSLLILVCAAGIVWVAMTGDRAYGDLIGHEEFSDDETTMAGLAVVIAIVAIAQLFTP